MFTGSTGKTVAYKNDVSYNEILEVIERVGLFCRLKELLKFTNY